MKISFAQILLILIGIKEGGQGQHLNADICRIEFILATCREKIVGR